MNKLNLAIILLLVFSLVGTVQAATLLNNLPPNVFYASIISASGTTYNFLYSNGSTYITYTDSDNTNATRDTGGATYSVTNIKALLYNSTNTVYYVDTRWTQGAGGTIVVEYSTFDLAAKTYGGVIATDSATSAVGANNSIAGGYGITGKPELRQYNGNDVVYFNPKYTNALGIRYIDSGIFTSNNTLQGYSTETTASIISRSVAGNVRLNSSAGIRISGSHLQYYDNKSTDAVTWNAKNFSSMHSTVTNNASIYYSSTNGGIYNAYALYSSNDLGNYELFISNLTQSSTRTRLTSTGQDEILLDAFQNSAGTVYFIYRVNSQTYLDSFCATDATITLGSKCAGETTFTPPTNAPPNLLMSVEDKAYCFSGCRGFDPNPLDTPKDMVEVTLLSNNTYVTTASCTAVSFLGTHYTLTQNNTGNPFNTPNVYSIDAHGSLGDSLTIQCSNGSNKIFAQFFVEETRNTLSSWDLKAGKGSHFDDRISIYESPAYTKVVLVKAQTTSNMQQTCYYVNSNLGTSGAANSPSSTTSLGGNLVNYEYKINTDPLTIQAETYSGGFQKYEVSCLGSINAGDNSRSPSITEARYLDVLDSCAGSYQPSRIINVASPVSGYFNDTFFYGQRPNYLLKYQYQIQNLSDWRDNTCVGTYQLTYSNGTNIYLRNIPRGFNQDWFHLMDTDTNFGNYLQAGTYNFVVTCSNSDANLCVQSATFNKTITIDANSCGNNPSSCGVNNVCNICSPVSFTCEDGKNMSVPPFCEDQICYNQTTAIGDFQFQLPKACFIYDLALNIKGGRYVDQACQPNLDMTWYTTITKNGQIIDPATINAFCTYDVYTWSSQNSNQTKLLTGTSTFDSPNRRFVTTLPNYANSLGCSAQFQIVADCYSDQFAIKKETFQIFNVVSGGYCTDGTAAGTCVFSRTNNLLDKPAYCDNTLQLTNNSIFCGCPPGTVPANSTNSQMAAGCIGNPNIYSSISSADIKGFLNSGAILWVALLLLIIGIVFNAYVK